MNHPFSAKSLDLSRNSCIGNGLPLPDNTSQKMSPHGFHHRVHILSGSKAGPRSNGDGSHRTAGPQIALCQNYVDHRGWVKLTDAGGSFVNQKRNLSLSPDFLRLFRRLGQPAAYAFHLGFPRPHGLTEGGAAADGRRVFALQGSHPKTAAVKAENHPRSQISGSSHQNPGACLKKFRVFCVFYIFREILSCQSVQPDRRLPLKGPVAFQEAFCLPGQIRSPSAFSSDFFV